MSFHRLLQHVPGFQKIVSWLQSRPVSQNQMRQRLAQSEVWAGLLELQAYQAKAFGLPQDVGFLTDADLQHMDNDAIYLSIQERTIRLESGKITLATFVRIGMHSAALFELYVPEQGAAEFLVPAVWLNPQAGLDLVELSTEKLILAIREIVAVPLS